MQDILMWSVAITGSTAFIMLLILVEKEINYYRYEREK